MADAEEKHFVFDAGDDETFDITFDQDISSWTVYFNLTLNSSSIISKEITSHDDAVNGETSFTLSDSETQDLSGNYNYELKYTTDAGKDETFLKGRMTWV